MGKNTNRRYKTHVFSDVFRGEKQAWRPFPPHSPALPREGGEKPQMYKYRGTVVRACTWEPDRSTVTILPLNNLFHLNQIRLSLSIKWQ